LMVKNWTFTSVTSITKNYVGIELKDVCYTDRPLVNSQLDRKRLDCVVREKRGK